MPVSPVRAPVSENKSWLIMVSHGTWTPVSQVEVLEFSSHHPTLHPYTEHVASYTTLLFWSGRLAPQLHEFHMNSSALLLVWYHKNSALTAWCCQWQIHTLWRTFRYKIGCRLYRMIFVPWHWSCFRKPYCRFGLNVYNIWLRSWLENSPLCHVRCI